MSEARGVIRAYLGLGANLGDRRETLEHAISLLSQRPGIRLLRISSLYETEPVDVAGGWFFNGVVEAETSLAPQQLLETLLQVEEACGRPQTRGRREERVVDIDPLLRREWVSGPMAKGLSGQPLPFRWNGSGKRCSASGISAGSSSQQLGS